MGKLTINGSFSIAMLNYQRVNDLKVRIFRYFESMFSPSFPEIPPLFCIFLGACYLYGGFLKDGCPKP